MPVILATQEAEIRRITVQSQSRQIVCETLSHKTLHKTRAGEWLKVKALSSNPSIAKKKKRKKVYSSVVFSIFTDLCNHHYSLRTFFLPQEEII
jgi:hypothetical protein